MAKVYSKNNSLKADYEKAKKNMIKSGGIAAIFFIAWMANIFIFHSFNPAFLFPCFIGFGGSGVAFNYFKQKSGKLESGVQGEESTVNFLSNLPDTYGVISNAKITYERQTSELDNVVVGPTGIFVIETKNLNGTITGNYLDNKLTQHKVGQGGNPYSNQFYNPVKQVSTQVYRLSKFLKSKGINTWVQGCVYFSNTSTNVEVEFDYNETPVFAKSNGGDRELFSYITEYNCNSELSQSDINRIINKLIE